MTSAMKIWKFPLPTDRDAFEILMPAAFNLSVQVQRGVPVLWAAVLPDTDDGDERQPRSFVWVGTGHPIPDSIKQIQQSFIGTVQLFDGDLVLHLFQVFA